MHFDEENSLEYGNFFAKAMSCTEPKVRNKIAKNSVPDPWPPGSASGSVNYKYGSGSFPFLIKVLSGLK
jgi:hypothetical protein